MCDANDRVEGSKTSPRPRWSRLYLLAGLMLGVLPLVAGARLGRRGTHRARVWAGPGRLRLDGPVDAPEPRGTRSPGLVRVRQLEDDRTRDPLRSRAAGARAIYRSVPWADAEPVESNGRDRALADHPARALSRSSEGALSPARGRSSHRARPAAPSRRGRAVIAGSNPRRLESMGIIVPAKPGQVDRHEHRDGHHEREGRRVPEQTDRPDHDRAHAAQDARGLHLPAERLPPAAQLHLAGREPADDHRDRLSPVLPEIAWITGMNDASRMTLPSV